MKNTKKGFTLVELVIVIAVIAILAGVIIFTFASVTKRASEAAKIQEMKSAEIAQKAEDILAKIDNANWYGWEDFEASIVDKITTVINEVKGDANVKLDSDAVEKAVSQAMAKYYAENAMANTGLTEAQVKAIVENAFGTFKYEGVSAEQVSAIVNIAVSKIPSPIPVTQVQRIVEAAVTRVENGQLSSAQITTIVANALANAKTDLATTTTVNTGVDKVIDKINSLEAGSLKAEDVERIIAAAVVSGGTTSWVDSSTYETEPTFTLTKADDVKGLATLVNGGYDFEDKVVVLPATVDLSTVGDWTPIGNSYDTQFEGTLKGATGGTVITGLTLTSQFNAVRNGLLIDCSSTGNMDKVGVGFVAYLGEGAVLENVTFKNVNINVTDASMDGICIGVAVGYLEGGTINNVHVESGSISTVYRAGGLVGAGYKGTITNCSVGKSDAKFTITTSGTSSDLKHSSAGGLMGYWRNFSSDDVPTTDANLVISDVATYTTITVPSESTKGTVFGQINTSNATDKKTAYYVNGTKVVLDGQDGANFDTYLETGTNKADLGLSTCVFE